MPRQTRRHQNPRQAPDRGLPRGLDRPSYPSASPAIGSDARIGEPQPGGRLACLVEYVDRDAAARVPIAADPQPYRGQGIDQPARDGQSTVFVKGAVVAKRAEIELQRFAFEDR